MTKELYRREALDHKHKGLYGEVILSAPPASWIITLIILLVSAILVAILFFGQVETQSGTISVFDWLLGRTPRV